jgi:hypothetical protein
MAKAKKKAIRLSVPALEKAAELLPQITKPRANLPSWARKLHERNREG